MDNHTSRTLSDLDELDLQIVRLLQEDGRLANVAIARRSGVSEPTVRKRVERLTQDGIIRITAVLNPRKAGYNAGVVMGIRTYPGRAHEVAEQFLPLNEVVYVGYVTGRFDLIVELLLRDEEQMLAFLSQRLAEFPGIAAVETFHILRADKINFDWKLLEDVVAGAASSGERRASGAKGRHSAGNLARRNGRGQTRPRRVATNAANQIAAS